MKREKIIKIVELLSKGGVVNKNEEWINCACPYAKYNHEGGTDNIPSFGISVKLPHKYYCFSCQCSGNIQTLMSGLLFRGEKRLSGAIRKIIKNEKLHVYEDYEKPVDIIPSTKYKTTSLKRLSIFKKFKKPIRGMSVQSMKEWGVLFDEEQNMIVFCIKDKKNKVVSVRGRYIGYNNSGFRYKEYPEYQEVSAKKLGVWYGMHFPTDNKKVICLVEGEIKGIHLKQTGLIKNVWASMGCSISKEQLYYLKGCKAKGLLLYFDNDKAGKRVRDKVVNEVKGDSIVMYEVTNYYGTKDAEDAIRKNVIKKVLNSVKRIL